MPYNVMVRDDGGGIYLRPVPENYLNFGNLPYVITPTSFVRCVLASLTTSATAARSANVVAITSTAHGIPNTYNGFRFYYPGSPTLAAGWVDDITIVDANTIVFPSVGANFASESINAGAAYVTATNILTPLVIPAGTITASSSCRLLVNTSSLNTAATKSVRPFLGATAMAPIQSGTTANCAVKEWELAMLNSTQMSGQLVANSNLGLASLANLFTFDPLAANSVAIQLTVSAAQDFIAIISPPKLLVLR